MRGAALFSSLLLVACAAAAQATPVRVPSLDRHEGRELPLPAYWFPVEARADAAPRPAIVLLHGCGGIYGSEGQLTQRLREYAALLNREGWHVLVPDSLSPRGESELCTQKAGGRAVTQVHRRRDAQGALQWLAAQPGVDAGRLALLGWSNGGSTVLAATNLRSGEVKAWPLQPRAAVAFYPGCEGSLQRGYAPSAPLLMLLGEADDWTPAASCQKLAENSAPLRPQLQLYPGAYHGFDGTVALRLRVDVPNGVHPGQGVHVGGQPAARAASRSALLSFLKQQLQ